MPVECQNDFSRRDQLLKGGVWVNFNVISIIVMWGNKEFEMFLWGTHNYTNRFNQFSKY